MRMTFGFSRIFFTYLLLACFLGFWIGMISTSYLVSSMLDERMRDIGVIKASGCLSDNLFSYFMTEVVTVILSSCLVGAFIGILFYGLWSGKFSPLNLAFSYVEILIVIAVPIVSFFTSYFVGSHRLEKAILTSTVNAVSSQMSSLNLKRIGEPFLIKRLGWVFKLADRNVWRDRGFNRTIICLSTCIFLTLILFTGGLTSADTTKSYLERAMPRQVLIIGKSETFNQYIRLAESFSTADAIPPFDYLNKTYVINPLLAEKLREIPGVEEVDTRLITMSRATGEVKAHISGGQIYGALTMGSSESLIVGIDSNHKVGEWLTSNGFLEGGDDQNVAVAGDSHLEDIVHPSLQFCEVKVFGKDFQVTGVCVDPLNRGRVLFIPLKSMQRILEIDGYNIILVKTNNDETTVSKVKQMAEENGLVVGSQDKILDANLFFLDHIWSYILILPTLTLISTSGIFFSYLATLNSKRFKDYLILKVLGAKNRTIFKLLLWEASIILTICVMFALPLGFFFQTVLLIPEPKIIAHKFIQSAILLVSILVGACIVGSTLYSRKIKSITIKDIGL